MKTIPRPHAWHSHSPGPDSHPGRSDFGSKRVLTVYPAAPNKPNRRSRPERSAAQSNGSTHRSALPPCAPNKPNSRRFWPKNAGRPEKQSQTNPIAAGVLSAVERSLPPHGTCRPGPRGTGQKPRIVSRFNRPAAPNKANRRSRPERSAAQSNGSAHRSALSPCAPNKPNSRRFWPKNGGLAEKQSQSKPICPPPGPRALRPLAAD
jgi:hypothetical protein